VEPNLEHLREIFQRFNESGEIGFDEVDPEVELHGRPDVPDRQVWRGVDGVRAFLAKTAEHFDPIRWEPREMVALGRHVIVSTHVTACGAASGAPIEFDEGQLWAFRDGLIVRLQGFPTVDDAHAAARALDEAEGLTSTDP
jgi:ketosteroid isomerase-like protein